MKPYTARILHRYVPIIVGLLAAALYIVLPFLVARLNTEAYWLSIVVVGGMETCLYLLRKIGRFKDHASEEAYLMSLIIGALSYFLPTLLLFFVPLWIVLIMRVEHAMRTITASFLGIGTIATIAIALCYMQWLPCSWLHFWEPETLIGWIGVGIWLSARVAITTLRQSLHVR